MVGMFAMARLRFVILAAAVGACALGALAPDARATNGTRFIASGSRSAARGGVDIGVADDATGINANPAGMAFIDGQRFDNSAVLAFPSFDYEGARDSQSSDVTLPLVGGTFGVVFDLDTPWHLGEALSLSPETFRTVPSRYAPDYEGSGLKLGFGIFPLAASKLDVDYVTPFWDADPLDPADPNDDLPRDPQAYESDLKEVLVTFAVAWRATEWLSIGVAPSFVYSDLEIDHPTAARASILQGHPLSQGDGGSGDITYADLAPALGIEQIEGFGDVDDARSYGFRIRLGVMLVPTDWLKIGLTYATQTFKQDYLGEASIDMNRQLDKLDRVTIAGIPAGNTLKAMVATNTGIPAEQQDYKGRGNVRIGSFDAPQELGVGFSVNLYPFMFGADVLWLNWSQTYDKQTIKITDNTSAELNELTGDLSATQVLEVPLDWDDQVVLSLGAAFAVTDWLVVRAGYNYGRNPVPSDTILLVAPAIFEHHVTGGFSLYYRRLEIHAAVEYALPTTITARDHRGNASLSGTEIEASALFVGVGASLRF